MYRDFEDMPNDSRIWIFQADRELNDVEISIVEDFSRNFLDTWKSHGNDIFCSFKIFYKRFLILLADENVYGNTECCAIDASVKFVKTLEEKLSVSFLGKRDLAFMQKDKIFIIPLKELHKAFEHGSINDETLYFDNTFNKKSDIGINWPSVVKNSWLMRACGEQLNTGKKS